MNYRSLRLLPTPARLKMPSRKPKILRCCSVLLVGMRSTEPRHVAASSAKVMVCCSFRLNVYTQTNQANKPRGVLGSTWHHPAYHNSVLQQPPCLAAIKRLSGVDLHAMPYNFATRLSQVFFPGPMHIIDLAIIPDLAIALLLDWTDTNRLIDLPSRPARLEWIGKAYRDWVGNDSDRVNAKFFSPEILKPGGTSYTSVSQHYISAAAARGLLIFLEKLARQFAEDHGSEDDL